MISCFAHGKLLLSAEYLVMHGSKALALPLQLGQSLRKIPSENRKRFTWKATYKQDTWFIAQFDPSSLTILETTDPEKAKALREMILACMALRPPFQEELINWDVVTALDFSPEWGLGSSSTLTALLAEWAEVNALELHTMVSEGSGYDVACAKAKGPILYEVSHRIPRYQHVPFLPSFSDSLYFAWLGTKQPTAVHLNQMTQRIQPGAKTILRFSTLTEEMMKASDLTTFQECMKKHEELLSGMLGIDMISTLRFPELPGVVKSLGAWGGDFVMIASDVNQKELFTYLYEKGIRVIYGFEDLIYYGGNIR